MRHLLYYQWNVLKSPMLSMRHPLLYPQSSRHSAKGNSWFYIVKFTFNYSDCWP